ncbi:MAG: GntR family transcriptional regulator [Eubacterium sp.]|nr:GntR family transcriptional regulator [Eubacterium sp.]
MKLEFDPAEYLPLREVVFKTLRNAIIHGELKPGERLMEEKLAKSLEVSRTPVREAIRMLELEGLVVMLPRKGAEVARITVEDLEEALEVRMAIEDLSVRLASLRIDDEGKEKLRKAAAAFDSALEQKDVVKIVEKDERFHDVIFEATKNRRLINLAHSLREQVYRYRYEYVKDFSSHDKLSREHIRIMEAILNGDVVRAQQAMRGHIYDQLQRVIQIIQIENGDMMPEEE